VAKELAAVIVDDERLARNEMRSLLADHPEVQVIGEADSVVTIDEVAVVFVTAYDQHAMRAFEVNALDYLLKPVTPERLAAAVERLEVPRPPSTIKGPLEYDDRLFLQIDDRMAFLRIDTIKFIVAAGDYSYVHAVNGVKHLVQKPLKEWEERLPDNYFLRIHRSTIVNMEHVERLEPWSNYSYRVYMKAVKEPLVMSRRYALKAKDRLG
jgi:two-component system LytT family response regulator